MKGNYILVETINKDIVQTLFLCPTLVTKRINFFFTLTAVGRTSGVVELEPRNVFGCLLLRTGSPKMKFYSQHTFIFFPPRSQRNYGNLIGF